ncbi:MAG: acyltransferase [Eubacteriales bacterium]
MLKDYVIIAKNESDGTYAVHVPSGGTAYLPFLDIIRCAACMMVILLHSISPYILNTSYYGTKSWWMFLVLNSLCRTGVPLFLMISGYLLLSDGKSGGIGGFYKKRLPHIVLALAAWNVIYYLFFTVVDKTPVGVMDFIGKVLNSGSAYHLWYLYTLLGIYLLTPFLKKITDACTLRQLCLLLLLICFCGTIRPFINTVTPLYIYFFDPLANGYLGYFLLGYILGKLPLRKRLTVPLLAAGLSGFLFEVIRGHLSSSPAGIVLPHNGGYDITHFLFAAGLFVLVRCIFGNVVRVKLIKKLSKLTFGIYLVHVIFIELIQRYFLPELSPAASTLYTFLLATTCSLLTSFLLSKIKFVRNIII